MSSAPAESDFPVGVSWTGSCKWCYPDGPPDETKTETVVRSCRDPTTYHRKRDDNGSNEEKHDTNGREPESTNETRTSKEPINSITDLRVGQWVILESWERPLQVVEATADLDGTINLRGPGGGEYRIEGRPKCDQPYYLPKIGYLSEIIRVRVEIPLEAI